MGSGNRLSHVSHVPICLILKPMRGFLAKSERLKDSCDGPGKAEQPKGGKQARETQRN